MMLYHRDMKSWEQKKYTNILKIKRSTSESMLMTEICQLTFIREECDSGNLNDTWHAVKSMKAALKKNSSGPAYLDGKTWSSQLDDKVEPISTHFHWAIRNCDEDPEKLKSLLLNIVEHYKNNHQACHGSSRCKKTLIMKFLEKL